MINNPQFGYSLLSNVFHDRSLAAISIYFEDNGKENIFRPGWHSATTTSASVRSSLSVERISGSVEDSSRLYNDEIGDNASFVLFSRISSRVLSFRYVPFFLRSTSFVLR